MSQGRNTDARDDRDPEWFIAHFDVAAVRGDSTTRAAMEAFLARGGQTPEGERRLGALAGELGVRT